VCCSDKQDTEGVIRYDGKAVIFWWFHEYGCLGYCLLNGSTFHQCNSATLDIGRETILLIPIRKPAKKFK